MKRNLSALTAAVLFAVVFLGGFTKAEQPPNQLSVTPAFVNVELSDVNKQQKTQIAITNTFVSNIALTAELKGIDELGGKLLPVGEVDPNIASNIKLSKTDFIAPAKSTAFLEVLVSDSASLSPGGHYATLVLKQKSQGGQGSAYKSEISISIFIVKRGGERQDIALKIDKINQNIFKLPKDVQLTFTNKGNTHVTPRAAVTVQAKKGVIVSKGIANSASQPLLPGKSLNTNVALKTINFRWLPQQLTLNVDYRGDGFANSKNYKKTFWYVPPVFIALLILVITLVVFIAKKIKRIIAKRRAKKSRKKAEQRITSEDKIKVSSETTKIDVSAEAAEPTSSKVVEETTPAKSKSAKKVTTKSKTIKVQKKVATKPTTVKKSSTKKTKSATQSTTRKTTKKKPAVTKKKPTK